jgi:hypothetical protein
VLVLTVYVSPNTPSDEWKSLIFSNLAGYSPKVCKMIKFLARRICQSYWRVTLTSTWKIITMPNFYVEFMKDTFELDVLSDHFQGTTRSNSCIDMVFGQNENNLSCMNCVSYFSYHWPILSRSNHQAPQLTDITTLWVISINNVLYIQ